jgi:hypothetical protein
MPTCTEPTLSPADRRRQVASILARGVIRWRRRAKSAGIIDAKKSPPGRETGLELSRETRLSVSDGTRGFTPRDDGERYTSRRKHDSTANPKTQPRWTAPVLGHVPGHPRATTTTNEDRPAGPQG